MRRLWKKFSHGEAPTAGESRPLYQPLDPRRDEIRICVLEKGQGSDPLVCTLKTTRLSRRSRYFAISYVWGDSSDRELISVNKNPFAATRNLAAVLRRVRLPEHLIRLWADAVCINQNDMGERADQVKLMGEVYRQAQRVLIHLGDTENFEANRVPRPLSDPVVFYDTGKRKLPRDIPLENLPFHFHVHNYVYDEDCIPVANDFVPSDRGPLVDALEILRFLAANKHFHELPFFRLSTANGEIKAEYTSFWDLAIAALELLMQQPYWGRVWTLQEALLPERSPLVLFGPHEAPFTLFIDAYRFYSLHGTTCCKSLGAIFAPKGFSIMHAIHPFDALRTDTKHGSLVLSKAVYVGSAQIASEPRDHVYGVMGFVKQMQLEPDYVEDIKALWRHVSILAFYQSQSLALLCDRSGYCQPRSEGVASWHVDFSVKLGLPLKIAREARCGLSSDCQITIEDEVLPTRRTSPAVLQCHGLRIGRIVSLSESSVLLDEVEEKQDNFTPYLQPIHEHLRHCLQWAETNGIGRDNEMLWRSIGLIYSEFMWAKFHCNSETVLDFRRRWELALGLREKEDGERNMKLRIHLSHKSYDKAKRLFVTDMGEIGSVWIDEVEPGDVIYMLRTMALPAVLRNCIDDAGKLQGPCWEFLSCAILPGMEHCGCSEMGGPLEEVRLL